jgi:uncharacterized protein DUF4126
LALSSTPAAILLGGSVAASIHAGRATIRPISTVGTAGLGNPVLAGRGRGSLALTLAPFVVPVLAGLAVAELAALIVVMWRRRAVTPRDGPPR